LGLAMQDYRSIKPPILQPEALSVLASLL